MAQSLKMIRGPHLLYTGGNGFKTFGITVENLMWTEGCGYQKTYDLNDYTVSRLDPKTNASRLGMSQEDLQKVIDEVAQLREKQ